jgi:predicted alpha/beta superfamily hydrolase
MIGNKIFSKLIKGTKVNYMGSSFKLSRFSNTFKEKELAEEKFYIDKKERETMKKLLAKINMKNAQDSQSHQEHDSEDEHDLGHVLERHSKLISKELFEEILKWKRSDH